MSWILDSERNPKNPGLYKVKNINGEGHLAYSSRTCACYWNGFSWGPDEANKCQTPSGIERRIWWDDHKEQVEECKKALEPKIWIVKGAGATNVVHPNEEAAMAEAKRLASKCPDQRFYVLMATHKVEVLAPEPKVTEL